MWWIAVVFGFLANGFLMISERANKKEEYTKERKFLVPSFMLFSLMIVFTIIDYRNH
ncbi:MAG: hypothetical protein QMD50_03670 [Patescibacteria group bacterium]|nr:hypothetical protein [Patescibacteria group bacterium]